MNARKNHRDVYIMWIWEMRYITPYRGTGRAGRQSSFPDSASLRKGTQSTTTDYGESGFTNNATRTQPRYESSNLVCGSTTWILFYLWESSPLRGCLPIQWPRARSPTPPPLSKLWGVWTRTDPMSETSANLTTV